MGTATIEIGPEARIRRFWRAHARSLAHVGVLQAFCVARTVAWTPERVAGWYGIRVDRARAAARELAACGILRRAEGEQEAYRWSSALDWVDPTAPPAETSSEWPRRSRTRPPPGSLSGVPMCPWTGHKVRRNVRRAQPRPSQRRSGRLEVAMSPRAVVDFIPRADALHRFFTTGVEASTDASSDERPRR